METYSPFTGNTFPTPSSDESEKGRAWGEQLLKTLGNEWRGNSFNREADTVDLTARTTRERISKKIADALSPLNRSGGSVLNSITPVVQCFLPSRGAIRSIDEDGLVDLVSVGAEVANNPETIRSVELRIGFGVSAVPETRARIPAYVLAAKKILEAFRNYNKRFVLGNDAGISELLPCACVYSADAFVASANGKDSNQLRSAAEDNFRFIRSYLQEFSDPEIAGQFTFDRDMVVEEGSSLDAQIGYFASILSSASDPVIRRPFEAAMKSGAKYGSDRGRSARYSAAHAIYSSDAVAVPQIPILSEEREMPTTLVMIGGAAERVYWKLRKAIASKATIPEGIKYFRSRLTEQLPFSEGYQNAQQLYEQGCSGCPAYRRAQLISAAGEWPVYNKYDGDWTLSDVLEGSLDALLCDRGFNLSMKKDLLAILCDIASIPMDTAYTWAPTKRFEPTIRDRLEWAYEQFAKFCRTFLEEERVRKISLCSTQ